MSCRPPHYSKKVEEVKSEMQSVKKSNKIAALFCFHDSNRNSGATRSLLDIIDNLLTFDEIEIIAAFPQKEGTAIEYLKNKGVYIIPFCYSKWSINSHKSFFCSILAKAKTAVKSISTYVFVKRIGKILKEKNVEVVYNNTITIQVGALIKKTYGLPLIWHIREFGYEDHRITIVGGVNKLYKTINKYADRVICISYSLANRFSTHIDSQKMLIAYNDISNEYIIPNHSLFESETQCNILVAGIMKPTKGQLDVVKAVEKMRKKYPQVHLYIAGYKQGIYYDEIKQYVFVNGLSGFVHFIGFISNMNSIRSKMDIAIVASSSEAFGRVTIEAMLSGLLVIGADCGATRELIINGYNGYLYQHGNIDSLKNVIESALKDSNESQRIASIGQKDAIEKYTTGKCSSLVNEMIKKLAEEYRNLNNEK